jgi:iron complex outermembrane receptor protein
VLAARVPSLYVESSNGRLAPRFYIRGLGNSDFDLAASQPVSVIVDEVVLENVILKSFPMFDMEHVEVLRGPQGTLFGRNTPAGIVKFDTRKPTQEFTGDATLSYGDLGSLSLEGAVGGGITDTVSFRVSALYHERDDWIGNRFTHEDNVMGGYDEFAYRAQLLVEPSDSFSALLNLTAATSTARPRSSAPTSSARAATASTRTTTGTMSPTTPATTTRSTPRARADRSSSTSSSAATRR